MFAINNPNNKTNNSSDAPTPIKVIIKNLDMDDFEKEDKRRYIAKLILKKHRYINIVSIL